MTRDALSEVRAWAPFKISLAGEHAVGYGGSSVVAALDAGVEVTARASDGQEGSFRSSAASCSFRAEELAAFAARVDDEFSRRGPEAWRLWSEDFYAPFKYALGSFHGLVAVTSFHAVSGDLTWSGCGLGTSSASAACLIRVCTAFGGREISEEDLEARILAVDRLRHGGIPSGVDGAVVVRGGALRFSKARRVPLPAPDLRVLLVHTGEVRSCGEVISRFRDRGARRIEAFVREMEEVTECVARALAGGDLQGLFEGVERDRRLLERHGLGHTRADELAAVARRRGAAAVKLTGAGGGGALFCLFEDEVPERVLEELRALGVPVRACRFGGPGAGLTSGPAAPGRVQTHGEGGER